FSPFLPFLKLNPLDHQHTSAAIQTYQQYPTSVPTSSSSEEHDRRQTKSQRRSRCKLGKLAQLPCKTHIIATPTSNLHIPFPPFHGNQLLPIPFTVVSKIA
ncbi:hypothetical protein AABB24_011745, partial [Solanum stoloniferum]